MRDDLTFAERMHRDLREVRWPEPAEIRPGPAAAVGVRRWRRRPPCWPSPRSPPWRSGAREARSRAGVLGRRRLFQPQPEPSGSAEIPQEALLEPTDVGVRSNVRLGDTGLGSRSRWTRCWSLRRRQGTVGAADRVPLLPLADPASEGHARSGLVVGWPGAHPGRLPTRPPGRSARFFTKLDRIVTACAGWTEVAPKPWGLGIVTASVAHTWRTVERDFAGDEAVLLRQALSQPVDVTTGKPLDVQFPSETRMVVRVGDLVTVIGVPAGRRPAEFPPLDERRGAARTGSYRRPAAVRRRQPVLLRTGSTRAPAGARAPDRSPVTRLQRDVAVLLRRQGLPLGAQHPQRPDDLRRGSPTAG